MLLVLMKMCLYRKCFSITLNRFIVTVEIFFITSCEVRRDTLGICWIYVNINGFSTLSNVDVRYKVNIIM